MVLLICIFSGGCGGSGGCGQFGDYGLGSPDLVSYGHIDLGPERQEYVGPRTELDESYLLSGLERLLVFCVAYHSAGEESGYLAAEHLGPVLVLKTMVVLSFLVDDLECQAARYVPR